MSKLNPLQFLEPIFRSLVNHARVQRSVLEEQQKQTIILSRLLKYFEAHTPGKSGVDEKKDITMPLIIHPRQVAYLTGLSEDYAGVKCRKIKKAAGIPKGEPLPLQTFCEFYRFEYATVVNKLKSYRY